MKKVIVLTSPDAAHGFRLSGIEHMPAKKDEVYEKIKKCLEDKELGLIILEEGLIKFLPEDFLSMLEKSQSPMFAILPSPIRAGKKEAIEDYTLRLIRKAIGYQLRIKR